MVPVLFRLAFRRGLGLGVGFKVQVKVHKTGACAILWGLWLAILWGLWLAQGLRMTRPSTKNPHLAAKKTDSSLSAHVRTPTTRPLEGAAGNARRLTKMCQHRFAVKFTLWYIIFFVILSSLVQQLGWLKAKPNRAKPSRTKSQPCRRGKTLPLWHHRLGSPNPNRAKPSNQRTKEKKSPRHAACA